MSLNKINLSNEKVPIEVAIDRAGFGLYSLILTTISGFTIISFACVGYASTILVPASACELQTTPAQQGVLAAAPIIGSIIGALIWGYLADKYGRRMMLLWALVGGAIVNSIACISVNWVMLMIIQLIASIFVSGLTSMGMAILSESVPMQKRNLVVLLVISVSLLSQGIMAVLAIPIIPLTFSIYLPSLDIYWNSWRTLVLVYSVPCLITALCIYCVRESPKFLLSKGDADGALDSLRIIHRVNNLFSKKELEVLSLVTEKFSESKTAPPTQTGVLPLFKMPLLKYTIIMTTLFVFQQIGAFMIWLPTIANQFVTVLERGEGSNFTICQIIDHQMDIAIDPDATPCALNVTALLIVLILGAVQSVVNILLTLIVNKVGRRNIVLVLTSLCGIAGILVNLVPNAIGSAVMFGVQLMGFIVLGMYTAMVVALYPTHLRAIALAFPLAGGRLGTFASIQILNLMLNNNCEAGFYLFNAIFASSAIIASFLPDDRHLSRPPPNKTLDSSSDDSSSSKETYRNIQE